MKPAAFTYHRGRDVDGVTRLLRELGEDAKVLAGGQSLVPMMNFRLARPQHLVDIAGLRELVGIHNDPDGALRIGALTTHHAVETAPSTRVGRNHAVVREAMRWVGHLPIRTRGTVGGSLAHADATAEWCLLAILLDAQLTVRGPDGERAVPAADFFHGYFTTALDSDELLTEIVFPRPAPHSALTEFAERHGDFATVSAAVSLDLAEDGDTVRGARIVLGGVDALPVRCPEAEAVLSRDRPGTGGVLDECAEAAAEHIDPPSDDNGSAHYRRLLTRTLVRRACEEAMTR
ncbi:FAD binding domain-containing protein [Streptomyces oceani]|uniref:Molybdopterin dehydrogenase n=1 Tax=Streptomyces oceani TaxID=1075402 RepID=A0A1E7KKA2_9ACTN|nr:xanthine dehydrogenase family protein subunit M [Streptomyces oceani]OEV04287.1 molybdopterin dehydrogenase [Streptomyces oceani]